MKVVDSFIFYNELDLLKYRLVLLDKYVDNFILVEARYTHSGREKELYYDTNKHLFEEFNHKIIHIILDQLPHKYPNINYGANHAWQNENFNRNQIALGIDKIAMDLEDDDVILTSDLDEITNPEILIKLRNNTLEFDRDRLNKLALDFYYYNLNTLLGRESWHGVKLLTYRAYKALKFTFQTMRVYEHSAYVRTIPNGGWHLSYFGYVEFIKNKLQHFAHQEFNNAQYVNNEFIMEHIKNKTNMFDSKCKIEYIKTTDNKFLPPQYETYLSKYYLE